MRSPWFWKKWPATGALRVGEGIAMHFHSQGIILKNLDYQEADKLVTIFTVVRGKTQALARGIKKPGSSLRPLVQPFCHVHLYLARGRSLDILAQGRMINFYGNIRQDLSRTMQALYIMELLDKALLDQVPLTNLFNTTIEVLLNLDEEGSHPLLLRYFELRLLIELGYAPVLSHCVMCHSIAIADGFFKLSEGGLLCASCAQKEGGCIRLKPDNLALLRLMQNAGLQIVKRVRITRSSLEQLERFLEQYLEYYLERRFVMKNTIRVLKQKFIITDP